MKLKNVILMFIALLLLVFAIAITYFASVYISKNFNPPIVEDLLWKNLPYLNIFWLSEILSVISIIFLLIWSFKRKQRMLFVYGVILYSVFHFFRAGLIVLTPLGFPSGYCGLLPYGEKSVFFFGNFPSGHLSIPYLTFMITRNKCMLILTILSGLVLLVSHGHYSIDLVGTLLLCYPLFKFSEKHLRRFFENERNN